MKFIVVDDDPINNKLCRHIIKNTSADSEILDFTLPSQGLEHIKQNGSENKKILLLDLNMPIISGWDFLDRFNDMEEKIKMRYKIYILSSSIDDRDRERAKENRYVSGYLTKPLTKDKVKTILSEVESAA